jgi:hypothetical protein
MGRTRTPFATTAVLAAVFAAWQLTGGMHGSVLHIHTPPAASAITTAVTTQCELLPTVTPTASPSASPSTASSGTPELCVGVQTAQDSTGRGKTATWTITVQAENGPATSVIVTLGADPVQLTPAFTTSCPSGSGNFVCTIGDMGTATTPASYQLQAQVTIPADTTDTALTVTASAATSPAMTANPSAGQTITITGAQTSTKASSSPARTPQARPVTVKPVPTPATHPAIEPTSQPAILPVTRLSTPPTTITLPTAEPGITTVAPGDVASALPQISPVVATSTPVSSPAANVQAVGAGPTPSATSSGDSFSITIGMSAQTAQILGWILLALVITLVASRLISNYTSRNRPPQQREPKTTASKNKPRMKLPALHLPRLKRPQRMSRAERSAVREQNWRRYLESQRQPAAEQASAEEAPQTVTQNPL